VAFNKKSWQSSNFNEKTKAEEANRKMSDGVTWGQGQNLNIKVLEIGDWDMDADTSTQVPHGLSDHTKIRAIKVIIRADDDSALYDFHGHILVGAGALFQRSIYVNSLYVELSRDLSGPFDTTLFNLTAYNRGWVTIWYEGD
jgi:hypothetical protein